MLFVALEWRYPKMSGLIFECMWTSCTVYFKNVQTSQRNSSAFILSAFVSIHVQKLPAYIKSSLYHSQLFLFLPSFHSAGICDILTHGRFLSLAAVDFLEEHNNNVKAPKPHEHHIALVTLSISQRGIRCSASLLSHIKCLNHATVLARDRAKLRSQR